MDLILSLPSSPETEQKPLHETLEEQDVVCPFAGRMDIVDDHSHNRSCPAGFGNPDQGRCPVADCRSGQLPIHQSIAHGPQGIPDHDRRHGIPIQEVKVFERFGILFIGRSGPAISSAGRREGSDTHEMAASPGSGGCRVGRFGHRVSGRRCHVHGGWRFLAVLFQRG